MHDQSSPSVKRKPENVLLVKTKQAKEFQMHRFLSDGAKDMVQNNANVSSPETFIVQKNVRREEVRYYPNLAINGFHFFF